MLTPLPSHSFILFLRLFLSFHTMEEGDHNPYHHQNPNPSYFLAPNPLLCPPLDPITVDHDHHRRERFPQWTQAETKEFMSVRAELDASFTRTKRNKPLWEAVAAHMWQRGFTRTPEQCKSKWKNLVTRYKGSEAMDGDRQFTFHEEMRSIFAGRMERLLDFDEKEKEGVGVEEEKEKCKKMKRRRKGGGEVAEALRDFTRKQMEMEARWMEAAEAREAERRWEEEEWRRRMEALEEERAAMERRWRDREEEWRAREEARDERRHAVITAILSKVIEDSSLQD